MSQLTPQEIQEKSKQLQDWFELLRKQDIKIKNTDDRKEPLMWIINCVQALQKIIKLATPERIDVSNLINEVWPKFRDIGVMAENPPVYDITDHWSFSRLSDRLSEKLAEFKKSSTETLHGAARLKYYMYKRDKYNHKINELKAALAQ